MKVLYLTEAYSPHDRRFVRAMVRLGHQVVYVPWRGRPQHRPPELPKGVVWDTTPGPLAPHRASRWLRALARLVENMAPDVIHAGPLPWGPLGPALLRWSPLISMSWGFDLLWHGPRKPWLAALMRWVLHRSTLLLADCRAVAVQAMRWGMPWERIVLFPWGTDLDVFSPGSEKDFHTSWGWPEDVFVWVHARTWSRYYGADTTLLGFLQAWREEPRLRLLFLGGGPLESWIRRTVDRFHAQDVVRIVGRVPEETLARYFRAADGYVSMSHSDGSSVTLMQALATGLLAVVSDIPGNREWVTPGVEGYLVPVSDPHTLARALIHVAHLPQEARQRMARAARRRAEGQAHWKRHLQKLDRAYHRAVELGSLLRG